MDYGEGTKGPQSSGNNCENLDTVAVTSVRSHLLFHKQRARKRERSATGKVTDVSR